MIRKVAAKPLRAADAVELYGVSRDTFAGIVAALGKYGLDGTYADGCMEFRRLLQQVSWKDYERLLDATPDLSLPHIYDEGTLEFMSPRKSHDWRKRLVGRCIELIAFDLDINIQSIGSTTIRDPRIKKGFEPDEAYYVANEGKVRGKEEFEPGFDPPPDLILELDVTSSSSVRMHLFAAIGVPEVWRIKGPKLTFYHLQSDGTYSPAPHSLAFPFLENDDFTKVFAHRDRMGENRVIREFLTGARKKYREFVKHKTTKPKSSRRKDS